MRLLIPCIRCLRELGQPSGKFSRLEFKDDGRYEITCGSGHTTVTIIQEQKFELLFEIGAHAILDGYYRESVSSITSSLERFYEFAIRVFLEKSATSDTLFDQCWKGVSSQSERQLGAFIFLWATHFNEAPLLLSNKLVSFRNEVIHKGKIPSRDESLTYGNAVLNVLRPKMQALQIEFPNQVSNQIFRHLQASAEKGNALTHASTISIPTIISLRNNDPSHHQKSLEEHLIGLQEQRNRLFGERH